MTNLLVQLGELNEIIESNHSLRSYKSEYSRKIIITNQDKRIILSPLFPKCRPKSNIQSNLTDFLSIIICGYLSFTSDAKNTIPPIAELANDVICSYVIDDTASMALPSGQAASTRELPYLTFFTNVISCQGSRPV